MGIPDLLGRLVTSPGPSGNETQPAEVWREWSPATCELALSEMQPLVDFISEITARKKQREDLRMAG